ncbi:response regulator [Roseovarius sp. B08]|uniref:response regulator n=1 Tax=Roseovarius sp. B08 TaxID=3449223 RepID=UPI003EDB93F3
MRDRSVHGTVPSEQKNSEVSPISLSSVLVVEDDPVIRVGLEIALDDAGCESLQSVCCYQDALAAINADAFDYCILDLDLGNTFSGAFLNEPEGKRLLAVLKSRGVSTVVYSGILGEQGRILDIDPSAITIDKTEPAEIVIETLSRMPRGMSAPAASRSVADTP